MVLDYNTVLISFLTVSALCFPLGYLVLNFLHRTIVSRIPFFAILPLYLSVGLALQILTSFFIGIATVSMFVPLILAITASIAIILLYQRRRIKLSLKLDNRFVNIFSVGLLSLLVLLFAIFPAEMKWPPAGDAIQHSLFTTLAIEKGHTPVSFDPISPNPASYPTAYYVFAAELSLLLNINSGEAILVLAGYIIFLISTLLFSFTYILTRSVWFSLSMPFTIMIVHSTGNLERWIFGIFLNGTYPNLFGFLSLLMLLTLLQIFFASKKPLIKMPTIFILILMTMFVTYPSVLTHAIISIGIYCVMQVTNFRYNFKATIARQTKTWIQFLTAIIALRVQPKTSSESSEEIQPLRHYRITSLLIVIFIIASTIGGLLPHYNNTIMRNVAYLEDRQGANYLDITQVLPAFLSDKLFTALFVVSIIASAFMISLKSDASKSEGSEKARYSFRLEPLSISFLTLILITALGFIFIMPQRTLTYIFLIAWPITAYFVSIVAKAIPQRIIYFIITASFLIIMFYLQIPDVMDQIAKPTKGGWFLTMTDSFGQTYNAEQWIASNVKQTDLILTDRTYSSMYIHAFAPMNISHHFWNRHTSPMPEELSMIWTDPSNKTNVQSLLEKYDVRYILLTPEYGYIDHRAWGGSDKYLPKPYTNAKYHEIFSEYDFLEVEFKEGRAVVYSVR